jgi:ABC-type transport system involved in multi-copper enzyme maturation permease subunit
MFSTTTYLVDALLLLIQVLAALPWLAVLFLGPGQLRALVRRPREQGILVPLLVALVCIVVLPAGFQVAVRNRTALETLGYVYAVILQLQLIADLFVVLFAFLLLVWPKGGAIALASFREGIRQPMFWLLFGLAFAALTASPLIPYYTFGEDHLVVKDLGYDWIMLAAVIFGTLAASLSISEEIEGRTAVTLMSKPVSRRQFLLGKFVGLVLAGLVLFGLLGTYFEGIQLFKHWWDRMDPTQPPPWLHTALMTWQPPSGAVDLLRGAGMWTALTLDTLPGLILSFSQVMVLVAISVSLATRVPMVVNLATVLVIYFLAHLTPVLMARAQQVQATDPGSTVAQLLGFVARLFDTLLPDLGSFRLDPALISDNPLPAEAFARYIGSVSLYGILYTSIVLLFGLILFEDRDLA